MAKIVEKTYTITLSKIAKTNHEDSVEVSDDFAFTVESVVQELVGDAVIVEVSEGE